MSEVLKTAITGIVVAAGITILVVVIAGAFALMIVVVLVGTSFPGLKGAAKSSACLAYLAVVSYLELESGAGGAVGLMGKKTTILQYAKLMISVREIFLNDEKDEGYSNIIYEQYVRNIASIKKDLVVLKLKEDVASREEKKQLKVR